MKHIHMQLVLIGVGCFAVSRFIRAIEIRNEEREKRKEILREMGTDVLAIHKAADVVNARIERGEIQDWDDLRDAVTNEVAFQKISLREEI